MRRIVYFTVFLSFFATIANAQTTEKADTLSLQQKVVSVASADSVEYTDALLDTLQLNRKFLINDYSMIGVQYGYTLSQTMFNPTKKQGMLEHPLNFGVTYTRYGKLFSYMPYFGFQTGFFYGQSGYIFKKDKKTGVYTESVDGATSATYSYLEVPLLAHFHVDVWHLKLIANVGLFGSWRFDVEREGDRVPTEYLNKFYDYERRIGYGIKGGVGIGFVFDPVEFHIQGTYRYSLGSLYKPDYASEYYYRFAHPADIIISAGLHFQLTKRTGKTRKQLKNIAKQSVYEPVENIDSNSR